jgi:hypothetical protein
MSTNVQNMFVSPHSSNVVLAAVRKTKKALTTPIKIRIESANYMVEQVHGIGYSKNQFSGNKFEKQMCKGMANWYADKIGQEWDALPFSKDFFRIANNAGCGFYFIDARDCSVVV